MRFVMPKAHVRYNRTRKNPAKARVVQINTCHVRSVNGETSPGMQLLGIYDGLIVTLSSDEFLADDLCRSFVGRMSYTTWWSRHSLLSARGEA